MSLKYFRAEEGGKLVLPLLVVEDNTHVEVRDCYLRSMKKSSQSQGPPLHMEEYGFCLNLDSFFQNACNEDYEASLFLKSCIFYNFHDSVRAGVNSAVHLEKCHMSECRNNAVYALNPRNLKVRLSTLTKPFANGVCVEMLDSSSDLDVVRNVVLE